MRHRAGRHKHQVSEASTPIPTVGELCDTCSRGDFQMRPALRPGDTSRGIAASRGDLQRESERLKLLLDLTNALVSNLKPHDLLLAISESIRQCMHSDLVSVWLPDAEQRQLRSVTMDFPDGKGFAREDLLQLVEGSGVGKAFSTGKPVVSTRAAEMNEPEHLLAVAEGLASGCCLPLISHNRVTLP